MNSMHFVLIMVICIYTCFQTVYIRADMGNTQPAITRSDEIIFKLEPIIEFENYYKREYDKRAISKSVNFIMKVEGFRNKPYYDVAGWTIGYGHHRKKKTDLPNEITEIEALKLLHQDVWDVYFFIDGLVKVPLEIEQKVALVSFAFNVGKHGFKRSSLLQKVNDMNFEDIPGQLSKWVHIRGESNKKIVCKGLVNRRDKEGAMWEMAL